MSKTEMKQKTPANKSSEIQLLIRKLRENLIKTNNDDNLVWIENSIFSVGEYLKLNRVFLFSDVLSNPIEWFQKTTTSKINQIKQLRNDMSKWESKDIDSKENLIVFSKKHRMFDYFTDFGFSALSMINIIKERVNLGMIFFENQDSSHILSVTEKQLLHQVTEMISFSLACHKSKNELIELKNKVLRETSVKDQFLASVSHEIKTPLSSIYNALYLLGTTDLNYEQKEFLEIARASLDQLSTVVDDILDISELESGQVEIQASAFDAEEEMIRIVRMQKSYADEKGLKIDAIIDPNINFDLIGDVKKIRQVLLNLTSNAIKFTDHGEIIITSKLISETPLIVEFSIRDTGIGIGELEINKLYEAFYRKDSSLSRKAQGLGLGLPIANNIVKLLGGTLCIDSQLNLGTTFTVRLPFKKGEPYQYTKLSGLKTLFTSEYPEDQHSYSLLKSMGIIPFTIHQTNETKFDLIVIDGFIKDIDGPSEFKKLYGNQLTRVIHFQHDEIQKIDDIHCAFITPVSRKSISLNIQKAMKTPIQDIESSSKYSAMIHGYALVVDDNRLNRITLESILKKIGIKSKSVDSGANAIDLVSNESFDIILMDMQMPDMDGVEATRRIRHLGKNYKTIPIIAVTANTFLKDYDLLKTSQIDDVIFKPIQIDQLNKMMRKYIKSNREIYIPDNLFIFDSNEFNMRFEGSFDIADEVIETFLQEYLSDMEKIRASIQLKNALSIITDVHYFKGSCAYLSGKRTVWIIDYILEAAKQNQLTQMELCMDMLEVEVKLLVQAINAYKRTTDF